MPLKRNFGIWDICSIIKFQPYLETLPSFFSRTVSESNFFQLFEAGWLIPPELAAILARPKQPEPSNLTGCITLILHWKFTVIMGEETSVLSHQKNIFTTSQSYEAVDNSSLRHEEEEIQSWGLRVYLIGYFQDILLSKQASASSVLKRKRSGKLCQMA